MSVLESYRDQYAMIDDNFLQFCASHGISTLEDFLLFDLEVLAASADSRLSSVRLKKGISQVLYIIDDGLHQPWLNGMELLEDAQKKHVLSTGCDEIDLLLQGGICEGHLTELAGPSSSGKTQICLLAASHIALKHTCNVIYLNTSNSFSSKRVAHRISNILGPVRDKGKEQCFQMTMRNIWCRSLFDIFDLLEVLHHLEARLMNQVFIMPYQLLILSELKLE